MQDFGGTDLYTNAVSDIYYDNFAMDRKRNYLVQRFREHNGRN